MDYFQKVGKSLGAVQTENPARMHLRKFIKHVVCRKLQVYQIMKLGKPKHKVL